MSSSRGSSGRQSRTPGRAAQARQAPTGSALLRDAFPPATWLRAEPTKLAPSSKLRPSGPRRLSDVPLDENDVLVDDFECTLDGVKVRVTAVLERTCVYVDSWGDRRLASKKDLWVEADKLPIRRRGIGRRDTLPGAMSRGAE